MQQEGFDRKLEEVRARQEEEELRRSAQKSADKASEVEKHRQESEFFKQRAECASLSQMQRRASAKLAISQETKAQQEATFEYFKGVEESRWQETLDRQASIEKA
ncbi:MAG: hypothetical protein MHM6MM_006822 [Cercozoa sp. M6MM]